MIYTRWLFCPHKIKQFLPIMALVLCAVLSTGCAVNPATGKSQFTALMSPSQELSIGAQEHEKVVSKFGLYQGSGQLLSYVRSVGARVVKDTERPDVKYKFYIIDSPIVNAFALPGGYIYVSRGLLALANDEAELAAVLSHEVGHITGKHSAERYSQSVITSIGASIISIAVDQPHISDALGLGSNLYLSSYSRGQEREADSLGLRYMTRGGYAPLGMADFLSSLQAEKRLGAKIDGRKQSAPSYLSTHPATGERVQNAKAEAANYASSGAIKRGRDTYLNKIAGLTYGDSAEQGFAKGQDFYHPKLGLSFTSPEGFKIINQPSQVIMKDKDTAIIFDMRKSGGDISPRAYITQRWMKGKVDKLFDLEDITIGGMRAATASFDGRVNGRAATIRLVAIKWSNSKFARFQVAIPHGVAGGYLDALKRTTYSLRKLSSAEKSSLRPARLKIVTASAGDTPASIAKRQIFGSNSEEYFRVLNGLGVGDAFIKGRRYKIVVE